MSWIAAADPLALLAIQSGMVVTPAAETGAAGGGSKLDTQQVAAQLGQPIPIVFGRRRNGKGGVMISPVATEARFENSVTNEVTAFYHLVLSEGQIDSIPVKDVFQRACRVGTHIQTYDRRAGTWAPGNYIVPQAGYDTPECPNYCGSVGLYPDMSTLSFQVTIPDGFDQWNRQVHCFIRGGMRVTRLVDSVLGPSDNFADLVKWMLSNSGRVPAGLIDNTALDTAATFLEANQFTCNCWLTTSDNVAGLLSKWAPYFLLGESNTGGKKGLKPLLPVNNDGTIKTTAIAAEYTFQEDMILPESLEISYTSLADRLPFVAQMTWRQQLEDDYGLIRTTEIKFAGTADGGPYESHDLSEFCTSEDHAAKVGAYILAKRVYTTHTIRFSARPEKHNTSLSVGSIIRVRLKRQATIASTNYHDFLYKVERITKTLAGDLTYECSHFPIDDQGRSLIALAVSSVTGSGVLLTSNKTGVSCDINSASDNSIPPETYIEPGSAYDPAGELGTQTAMSAANYGGYYGSNDYSGGLLGSGNVGSGLGGDGQQEGSPSGSTANASDNLDDQNNITPADLAALGLPSTASLSPISTGNPSAGVKVYVVTGNIFCNNGTCYNSKQLAYIGGTSPWITTTEGAQQNYQTVITAVPPSVVGVSISGMPPIGGDCGDLCSGALPNTTGGCYCPGVRYDFDLTNNGTTIASGSSWNRLPKIVYVPV